MVCCGNLRSLLIISTCNRKPGKPDFLTTSMFGHFLNFGPEDYVLSSNCCATADVVQGKLFEDPSNFTGRFCNWRNSTISALIIHTKTWPIYFSAFSRTRLGHITTSGEYSGFTRCSVNTWK